MVNALGLALPQTGVERLLQVGDIEDVGGGGIIAAWRGVVNLIKLIIQQHVGHAVVKEPSLMGICESFIADLGDDGGVLLVGHVVDGEGVLVVAEADFLAAVGPVRTAVDNALRIVDVAVVGRAALVNGVGRVRDIDHVETTVALVGAYGVDHVSGLVDDDVVAAAEALEDGGLLIERELLWLPEVEELIKVLVVTPSSKQKL